MKKQIIIFTLILSITNAQEYDVLTSSGKSFEGKLLALDSTGIKLKIEYGQIKVPTSDILIIRFPSFFNQSDSTSKEIGRIADSSLKFLESFNSSESAIIPPAEKIIDTKKQIEFIPYDDPPKPLSPIRPKYPKLALEAGIFGRVIIQTFVDENGRVKETSILQGIPKTGLDESAIEAIRGTRFKPAQYKGDPVGVWISIPVNFRLE